MVYIAAFGLDEGESIGALLAQGPPTPALAHLDIDEQGFAWLPEDDFVNHFAADVDPAKARVMHAVQQPLHWSALNEVMGVPAWKSHRSWFMVADGDQAIPPEAERQFAPRMGATTVEVPANHVAMVSHPDDVVQLISPGMCRWCLGEWAASSDLRAGLPHPCRSVGSWPSAPALGFDIVSYVRYQDSVMRQSEGSCA